MLVAHYNKLGKTDVRYYNIRREKTIKLPANNYLNVVALFPGYGKENGGNITSFYLDSGQMQEDQRSLKSCLRSIARNYSIDLPVLRCSIGELLDCRNNAPLPFHRHLVFIPIKVRKPLTKSDGATGFVNLLAIERILPAEKDNLQEICCYLQLTGGHQVPSLRSVSNVKRKIRQGKRALDYYLSLYFDQTNPGTDNLEPCIKVNRKRINFSKSLIFKLITDEDDDDDGEENDNNSGVFC